MRVALLLLAVACVDVALVVLAFAWLGAWGFIPALGQWVVAIAVTR